MQTNSAITDSPFVAKVLWRRKLIAFSIVATTAFVLSAVLFGKPNHSQPVAESTSTTGQSAQEYNSVLNEAVRQTYQHRELLRRLDQELWRVSESLAQVQSRVNEVFASKSYSVQPVAFSATLKSDRLANANRLVELESVLIELIQSREQLISRVGSNDALVAGLTERIWKTRLEIVFLRDPWAESYLSENDNSDSALQQAAFDSVVTSGEWDDIPIRAPRKTTGELQQRLIQHQESLLRAAEAIRDGSTPEQSSALSLKQNELPNDRSNSRSSEFFLFTLISISIASVVSIYYKPMLRDQGFTDQTDVANTLGVPVIGSLSMDYKLQQKQSLHWANLAVETAEYLLMAIAIIVVACFVFSETIRAGFMQGPLEGLIQIAERIKG